MPKADENYLVVSLVFLLAIIFTGTYSYALYEGYSFWESLFYIVLTVTTVGAYNYHPQTFEGEIITVAVVILGMGVVLLIASMFAKTLVQGQASFERGLLSRMRNVFVRDKKKIDQLSKSELRKKKKTAKRASVFSHF